MPQIQTILTHPGGAHKDELLACSVLLAIHRVPLVRREPTAADLADASVCVVDVGHVHDPALNNFDHHQLPNDHPPTCALSLVLQHLHLYEEAREFCEWLEPAEWLDCRGPFATAEWLGVERDILDKLNSPVDFTLLKRFAAVSRLEPGEPLWEILRMIGEDILEYVKGLHERLQILEDNVVFWAIPHAGAAVEVLFLPRTEPPLEDPSMGMDRFIARRGKVGVVGALVNPDRRGIGYGLSRFRDDPRFDFTRIAQQSDVHFAHARGFVAKTSATDVSRLKTLIEMALTPSSQA
jgi:hypothetical protein